jgi:hypothetical protein
VPVDIPLLILHGRQDRAVNPQQSVRFARQRPGVDLRLIDTDHQMGAVVDHLWQEVSTFFSLDCA